VHQDEGGTSNRPAILARLVGKQQVEARSLFPVGIGSGSTEGLVARCYKVARFIFQFAISQLVLLGVGIFNITDEPLMRVT
jgi:hypothetical protein